MNDTWNCNVCGAQNHEIDGQCQYCKCLGADCKRDNCDGPHPWKCVFCGKEHGAEEVECECGDVVLCTVCRKTFRVWCVIE